MIAKNPTIYDVARLAGVSSATVSRVLNEPSKVQPEKRKRVVDAITRLNFTPKAQAVANSRQQYKKIGVIAPFFTQPSFMQRLRGVSEILSNEHYELVLYA
ncbi:MAG TPA: LacI family transcriptional regulator, partial [Treponema sp.]|nr:LacI family transcriptional regulator [Treponema sp.]